MNNRNNIVSKSLSAVTGLSAAAAAGTKVFVPEREKKMEIK